MTLLQAFEHEPPYVHNVTSSSTPESLLPDDNSGSDLMGAFLVRLEKLF